MTMTTIVCTAAQVHCGPLLLVNGSHPLHPGVRPVLRAADERYPGIRLEKQAALLLAECIRSVGGSREIVPVSGWRSREQQQQIWDSTLAERGEEFTRRYVAFPGCSEHETGLAIDLGKAAGKIDFLCPAFPHSGICGAFRRAAADYGFIESYPKGKEAYTGIAHEPWHFRYVGVPHARLMERHGLCLEEYFDFLRRAPRSCQLTGGLIVQVFYVPCAGEKTEIQVPEHCCQISGDNAEGFVVTAWGRCQ